jgi:hypothetical protein
MTNTIQIHFAQNDNEAMHIVRPMPVPLRRIMTENDFESFADKVDLLLDTHDKLMSVLWKRFCRSIIAFPLLMAIYVLVNVLGSISLSLFFEVLSFIVFWSIPISGLISFFTLFRVVWHRHSLLKKIRMECTQLTNSTASATFELVLKYVQGPSDENGNWEISHIDVIISDS